ncbi:MAG: M28 family peptidase [Gemmatimonadota bacterium]|nr:M28 family peptidase [Gemmatimonadota bacterium]
MCRLPREAGTPGAAVARAVLTAQLQSFGYTVREQRFPFQPAALNAFPLLGAGLGWLTLLLLPLLAFPTVPRATALIVWLGGATALVLLAWGIGTGVHVAGAERREDANLIVTRGAEPVRRWIVAHLDTKAQRHSMAGRLVAVWVLVLAALVISGATVWRALRGPLPPTPLAALAGLSLAAGALAARGRLRGLSPGASDNTSGVVAALVAAEGGLGGHTGLLFTGAEEFGLVGARAFVADQGSLTGTEIINLDTLTDEGPLYVVAHNREGLALARALAPALAGVAPRIVVRHLPLGILTDSLPLARAGGRAVTLSRLDWGVLRRLHTPRDTVGALSLATAEAVGCRLAELR